MQASGCGVGVEGFETGGFLKDSHATVEFTGVQVLRIYVSLACQGIRRNKSCATHIQVKTPLLRTCGCVMMPLAGS